MVTNPFIISSRKTAPAFRLLFLPLLSKAASQATALEAVERSRAELNARFVELRFAKAHRFINDYPSRTEYHT